MNSRVTQLDGLRGISILLVLAAHLLPLGPAKWEINHSFGLAGMSLFFGLSGYLITSFLLDRPSVTPFLIRRFLRILPLAWLVLLILIPTFDLSQIKHVLLRFLFVQNYFHEIITPATGHYWSLCVELHFYLGIAALVLIGGARALNLLPLLCLMFTGFRVATGTYASIVTHVRVDEILTGACLALLMHQSRWLGLRALLGKVPLLPAVLLWLISCHPSSLALNYFRPYLAGLVIGGAMVGESPRVNLVLNSRVLGYLAAVSYAVYVIHGPLRTGWFSTGSTIERYLLKRPITLLLTFSLAHLSTYYYEKYFIAWGRRLTRPKQVVVEQPSTLKEPFETEPRQP